MGETNCVMKKSEQYPVVTCKTQINKRNTNKTKQNKKHKFISLKYENSMNE